MFTHPAKNIFISVLITGLFLTGSVYAYGNPNVSAGDKSAARVLVVAQQNNTTAATDSTASDKAKTSEEMAETARDAYKDEDSKPVENWFGCPPAKEEGEDGASSNTTVAANAEEDVDKSEPANEDCDPDAPQNDSPQKN